MKASILTIGDEILIGQIVDTNSASIARHLNNAGIVVWERTSVGDQREQITEAVKRAMNQSDVVILTGGLGPTKDDITKKTLAELFGSRLVCDQTVADHVRRMLEARGIEYNRLNRDQALVPACCTVLFNAHGTAPGMWFEQNGKVVVSLPGVPFEMEHLMTDEVMPRLKARFSLRQIVHRTLITAGLAESMLAEKIADWENALPPYLHLAYLPAPGVVRLRLSAYEVEGESVSHEIDRQFAALQRIIPRYVLGFERATMQEIVHNLLTRRRQTLATAESCTGGSIAARFTAIPGASAYFLCGVVAYSNESKSNLLGVDPETIACIARMRDYGSAFLEHAPAVVLVEGDRTATDLWRENAAITATALLFAATDAGLASCWVHVNGRPCLKDQPDGAQAEDYLREFLPVPAEHGILCAVALGYSDFEPAALPPFDAGTHIHWPEK